jgi:hypothetical protein
MRDAQRRSFVRACAATVLSYGEKADPHTVLSRAFPGDAGAAVVLRAAQSPTSTAGFHAVTAQVVLPMLAPQSASGKLLGMASRIEFGAASTVRVPYIGLTGRPAVVPFVLEGGVMPIVNLVTSSVTVGPVKKMLIGAALTRETQVASGDTAEKVIGDALAASAEQSLDALMFSNAAATTAAPAGLLNGVSGLTPTAGGGMAAITADLAALATAIASNGIGIDDAVIITTPALAMKLRLLSSVKFDVPILSSSSIAAGTVIMLTPRGFVTGYDGSVAIEITDQPAIHFEDTTPTDISVAGSPPTVAYPVRSLFQDDMFAIKIRCRVAWAVHPGAIAYVTGATW